MEMNDIYYLVLEFASSKEGIIAAFIFVYCCWFFVPAFHVAFLHSDERDLEVKVDALTKIIVFFVVFVILPPLLIVAYILNFLGIWREEGLKYEG